MARRVLSGFIFGFSILQPRLLYPFSRPFPCASCDVSRAPPIASCPDCLRFAVHLRPRLASQTVPVLPPSSIPPLHNSGVLPRVRKVRASKCAQDLPKPTQRFWMRVGRCTASVHQMRPLHGVSSAVCGRLVFALVAVELGVGLLLDPGSSELLFIRMP